MNSVDRKTSVGLHKAGRLSLMSSLGNVGVLALVLGAVVAGSAVAIAQEEPKKNTGPILLVPPPIDAGAPVSSVIVPPPANAVTTMPAVPAVPTPAADASPAAVLPDAMPAAAQPVASAPDAVVQPPAAVMPQTDTAEASVAPAEASPASVPATPTSAPSVPTTDTQAAPTSPAAPSSSSAVQPLSPISDLASALTTDKEAAKPENKVEVKEEPVVDARVRADQVMNDLRNGTFNKPLSLADMAAINDAIQRMNYLGDIERKIAEVAPNMAGAGAIGSAPVSSPVVPTSATSSGGGAMIQPVSVQGRSATVLQISGSQGKYKALVSTDDGRTMYIRVGDNLGDRNVVAIDLSGVRVRGGFGTELLPFRSQAPVLLGQ